MGTITVYRSDDASAPVLTGENGTLIAVLDACLVDGYGAKAAADWEKAFTDTNLAAYRAKAGNRFYLRVNDGAAQYPILRGYRAMSAISTGTGEFPTEAQLSGGISPVKSSTTTDVARPWILIASDRAFYLWVGFAVTNIASPTTSTDITFFGDCPSYVPGDAMLTLLAGKITANTTASNTMVANDLSNTVVASGHYLASEYLQSGNAVTCGVYQSPIASSESTGSAGAAYPDPVTGGLLIDRLRIWETGPIVRGYMPGIFNPLHNQPASHLDTLQGRGSMAGTDLLLLYKGGTAGRLAFSLNEADWLAPV
jgi:hypothetical protein